MICENCKAGAAAAAMLQAETRQDIRDSLQRVADRQHIRCTGGPAGCGCQHRGTAAARIPEMTQRQAVNG